MRITEEIWGDLPVKDGWVMLPNGTKIRDDCFIEFPCDIEPNCIIDSACVIKPGCIIGNRSRIKRGSIIEAGCSIGSDCHIGSCCNIMAGASIGDGCVVPKNTSIYTISFYCSANYSGVKDGEHQFRFGREIHPLSWFISRKRGCKENPFYESGWSRVWYRKEITAEEYRRYLRFFNEESKRLGI